MPYDLEPEKVRMFGSILIKLVRTLVKVAVIEQVDVKVLASFSLKSNGKASVSGESWHCLV